MRDRRYLYAAIVCFALAGLVLLAGLAEAQETPAPEPVKETALFRGLGIAYLCLGGADAAQTTWALGSGEFKELNPVMRPLTNYPAAFGAVKIGIPVFINYGTAEMWRSGPKGRQNALAVRIIVVGLQAFVVGWNARQLSRHKEAR